MNTARPSLDALVSRSETAACSPKTPVRLHDAWDLFFRDRKLIDQLTCKRLAPSLRNDADIYDRVLADVFKRFVRAVQNGHIHPRGVGRWLVCVVPCSVARLAPVRLRELARIHPQSETVLTRLPLETTSFELAEREHNHHVLHALVGDAMREMLTKRELEALALTLDPALADAPRATIAAKLGVSEERFSSYTSTARRKLREHFRTKLRKILATHSILVREWVSTRSLRTVEDDLAGIPALVTACTLGTTEVTVERLRDAAWHTIFLAYVQLVDNT